MNFLARQGRGRPGIVVVLSVVVLLTLASTALGGQDDPDNPDVFDVTTVMGGGARAAVYGVILLAIGLVSIVAPDAPLLFYCFSMPTVQLEGGRVAVAVLQCLIVVLKTKGLRAFGPSRFLTAFLLCCVASVTWAWDPHDSFSNRATGLVGLFLQLPLAIAVRGLVGAGLTTIVRPLWALALGCVPGSIMTIRNALAGIRYLPQENLAEHNEYYMGFIRPDMFSPMLVISGIFLLYYVVSTGPRVRAKVVGGLLLPLFCVVLLLTGIRSGWVGFGVAAMLLLVCTRKYAMAAGIVGLLVLAVVALSASEGLNLNRTLSARLSEKSMGSAETRVRYWEVAAEGFLQRPVLGIGWGSFPSFVADNTVGREDATHNVFIRLLCELGLVGFALFLTWGGTNVMRLRHDPAGRLMSWVMVGLLLQGLFLDHFICGYFWLCVGMWDGLRVAMPRGEIALRQPCTSYEAGQFERSAL